MEAEGKLSEVRKTNSMADQYAGVDDFDHAQLQRDQAMKFEQEAMQLDKQAQGFEQQANDQEARAAEISGQIDSLRREYDQKIQALEQQKRDLLG
jgi:hypothetical protein